MTLDTLTNAVNGILGFRGQRIGFPNGSYYNECTAVVAHLHTRLGIPLLSMYGGRADGWGVSFPGELAPYYDHEAYRPGKAYPYGTLLLWNSPHIAIVLSHDGGNMVQVFQQNADPNGAPCEVFNRVINNAYHTCTYALIPKLQVPAPVPEAPLWTVEGISPRQIKVNPGARKWNLAHHDFTSVRDNPITEADGDTHFTAVAVLHHRNIPQYNYYLEDANTPHGWNVLDCGDYTAPLPPPPPYVPPAEPLKGKPVRTYPLDWEVPSFDNPMDAMSHRNAKGSLKPKTYIIFEEDDLAYNLTENNMVPGVWINTKDNVPPLPPEPKPLPPQVIEAITTAAQHLPVDTPVTIPKNLYYEWIREDRQPVYFHTKNMNPQSFKDLEKPDTTEMASLPANKDIPFSMQVQVGKLTYLIPTRSLQNGHRHGIPKTMLQEVGVTASQPKKRGDRNGDGKINIEDITELMVDYGNKYLKPGLTAAINTAKAVKKSRVIDGIIAGTKKEKVK